MATPSVLFMGQSFAESTGLKSANGKWMLKIKRVTPATDPPSANLIIYEVAHPTVILWKSPTFTAPRTTSPLKFKAVMQKTGDFEVLYGTNDLVWKTSTSNPGSIIVLQNSGELDILVPSLIVWKKP